MIRRKTMSDKETIKLLEEEIKALLNFKSVDIYEDEEKGIKITVKLPNSQENINRNDILDRYNSEEYHNGDLEQ